jgi:hypothetical protein
MSDNQVSTLPAMSDDERMAKNKDSLLAALKSIGAKRATVTYSGCGGYGSADGALVQDTDGEKIDPVGTMVSFLSKDGIVVEGEWRETTSAKEYSLGLALVQFAMDMLRQHHEGWKNSEGGDGEVEFDPGEDKIRINHNAYFTDIVMTVREL